MDPCRAPLCASLPSPHPTGSPIYIRIHSGRVRSVHVPLTHGSVVAFVRLITLLHEDSILAEHNSSNIVLSSYAGPSSASRPRPRSHVHNSSSMGSKQGQFST